MPARLDAPLPWHAYPALRLAGWWAVGVAAGSALGTPAAAGLAGAAAAGVAAAGVLAAPRRRLVSLRPLAATVLLACTVAALGAARSAATLRLPPDHVAHAAGADAPLWLTGRLVDDPVERPYGVRLLLAAERLDAALGTHAPARAVRGTVPVTLLHDRWDRGAAYPALSAGQRVQLRGLLQAPPDRRNPSDFDYGAFLRRRGQHATLLVRSPADVHAGAHTPRGLQRLAVPLRAHVRAQVHRYVPSAPGRMVLSALVLGDRSLLDDATRAHFVTSGLMHLLAVSGLHVLLVAWVFYELLGPWLSRLGCSWPWREGLRSAATATLLGLYVLLTGAQPPVVRAAVMALVLLGGTVLQRSGRSLNTLGVAALVLLVARPAYLFEPGFQLSFAAVGALVVLPPVLTAPFPPAWSAPKGWRGQVGRPLVATTAATLGTLPVLLYHFGQASFAGLLLNPPGMLWTLLALAGGLAVALLGAAAPPLAAAFGRGADACARGLLWTADRGHEALGSLVVRGYLDDPLLLGALGAAVLALALWPRPHLRWRWTAAALACLAAAAWVRVPQAAPRLEVLFFDVGQGDAALVTTPSGRRLLIDVGGRGAFSDGATRAVLPHLERHGIDRLDAVLITHTDGDHLGGLPSLLRHVHVGRVLHNGRTATSALYRDTQHLLDSLAVPHRALRRGDTLDLDPVLRLQVLSPGPALAASGSDNDASVVLRLVYGAVRMLFLGDAEAGAEGRMAARYGADLRSDVVKVGHHGSSTSSTPAFVAAAADSGTVALVSVAARNAYGLPDAAVLARWRRQGAQLHATSDAGALWLRSDGRRLEPISW